MIKLLPFRPENADATAYVATLPEEGLAQLEILKSLGCKPHHKVLEIGCGALVAGYPIMQYLDAGGYSGIEPNYWLTMASLKVLEVSNVAHAKQPLFCPRLDFRAEPNTRFDFIISHSILSHASNAQLTDFLTAAEEQLAEGGTLVASIRLAEGNEVGSPGSAQHGAAFAEWQYPGVSWFKEADVVERARRLGLSATVSRDVQRVLLNGNPKAVHDWIVVRKTKVTLVTGFFRLPDRAVDEGEQFRRFDELAECGLPITLFLDTALLPYATKHKNVCVIPLRLGMLLSFMAAEGLELELPAHRDVEKDTRDFLLLQNAKLDMLKMALSGDDSTHYAWIDFGIMKIVRDPENFLEHLRRLSPPAKCVLAPGCLPFHSYSNADAVDWRFCGGFMLVDRGSVTPLVTACRAVFGRLVEEHKKLTWEVNIWAQAECAGAHFDWYKADHDDSILPGSNVPRICLCMIVKNEGAIIERCLASAFFSIDTWCIVDTGSTDDTVDKIERFFGAVPGKLVRSTFKNFAQARNEALDAARELEGWDYALLIDADMVLKGALDKNALEAPAYRITQHNGTLSYSNTRLVSRNSQAKYFGVTHEYLSVEGVEDLAGFSIDDINDGGSKSDKGDRDIRLLSAGLVDEPNNERYMFYLAQTYRETGRHHEAILWYLKRIAAGGWDEEIWASHYGIAQSLKALDEEARFIRACIETYNYRPSRGESLKLLARHYRETGRNEAALLIAEALRTIPYPGDHLFVERDVYDYGATQEIAIAGYYSKQPRLRAEGYGACADLTVHPNGTVREEARKNFTFYAKSAKELFGAEVREIDWKPSDGWAPMNPSVCIVNLGPTHAGGEHHARRLVLVRTVNYTVANGEYPTLDGSGIIRTRNHILEMNADWRPVKTTLIDDITGLPRSGFPVEGFEDCRLWENDGTYRVSATVRDFADNNDGRCEIAVGVLDDQWRITDAEPIREYEHDKTQKNWMPIVGRPGAFLYLCDPTITIEIGENEIAETRQKAPACLVDLRGGSQLIRFDDGWLCITHEVAWRPERVYLHRFVYLDGSFKIVAVTDPFYFKHVGIEFCAGLARDGDKLVASFGVNDASAHLAFFSPIAVSAELKYL